MNRRQLQQRGLYLQMRMVLLAGTCKGISWVYRLGAITRRQRLVEFHVMES